MYRAGMCKVRGAADVVDKVESMPRRVDVVDVPRKNLDDMAVLGEIHSIVSNTAFQSAVSEIMRVEITNKIADPDLCSSSEQMNALGYTLKGAELLRQGLWELHDRYLELRKEPEDV